MRPCEMSSCNRPGAGPLICSHLWGNFFPSAGARYALPHLSPRAQGRSVATVQNQPGGI